ncbi:class I SAM-dependent methyltransferase [Pendulispora rubella]|uniref:Class I SAM-dependent methyltransferase n=1 Tax=Pendulispora rubella TaxID=2741070 RepID=A0ABZ2L696_9BACT
MALSLPNVLDPLRRAYGWFLWEFLKDHPREQQWVLFALRKNYPIFLDYRVDSKPRYGFGKPPHAALQQMLARHDDDYQRWLSRFAEFEKNFREIPRVAPESSTEPRWLNAMLPALDGVSIYGFLAATNPKQYFEVGSGNSTKFAARAIRDHGLQTTITSIDPMPRAEIDGLCNHIVRKPLEDSDLSVFDALGPGDVLFVDNSHRAFMNSDVTVVFLEVLPRLKPGVILGIHDIELPYDYNPNISERYYSEQYLLAAYLLAGGPHVKPILPAMYASKTPSLHGILSGVWNAPELHGLETHGTSFWLEIQAPA